MNSANHIHFHALIFDSHKTDYKRIGERDSDKVLSRLYYQLLVHKFAKIYPNTEGMCVCLDHRNSSTPLEDLRRMINATLARDHNITHGPVKQLVSMDSCCDDILQINDVILGAVCAARNGKHLLVETREAKRTIAQQVLDKSGLKTFERSSPRGVRRFSVWAFDGSKRG
jgi:hypothetical protein